MFTQGDFLTQQNATPDQLARKRELLRKLMPQFGRANYVGEGVGQLLTGLAIGIKGYGLDKQEQAGTQSAMVAFSKFREGLSKGGTAQPGGFSILGPMPAESSDNSAPTPISGTMANARTADRVSTPGYAGLDLKGGIQATADALGISPVDLATAISYETAGTFDPTKAGPTTQWGQHKGLIQFGEPQAQKYGVDWNDPLNSQLGPNGAVAKYLRDTGVQPGMGLKDIYSAINAGGVGRYNASDANNGGAPGTVADKVENQMAGHRAKALAMFEDGQAASPFDAQPGVAATSSPALGYAGPAQAAPELPEPVEVASLPVATASDAPSQAPMPGVEVAQSGGMSDEQLMQGIQAINNGFLPPEMKAQAQFLVEQELARRQALQEQQLKQSDPEYQLDLQLKRAQLNKATDPAAQDPESFYGNPVPIQNPDGSISYGQIGNRGTFRPIQLGEGQTFAPPTKTIDAGTENIIVDQAGNVISRFPKNVAQTEAAKAEGKATGEASASLPQVEGAANELLSTIDSLASDPYLPNMLGPLDSRLPSLSAEAARVQSKMDQIGGQTFLQAFNTLKGAGQITEQEGTKATAAMARLNAAQNEKDYLDALNELRGVVLRALDKARQKAGQPAQPATSPSTGTEDPLGIR